MNRLVLLSPAKINLYLKVQKKRKDGYHDIRTLFQKIDLCDKIIFSSISSEDIKITCDDAQVPLGPKNLAYQAAKLMLTQININKGIHIHINKNIPVAAGLGGGSSNAATVLAGLNQLWNVGLSRKKLIFLAKKIGSDVPFFLYEDSWAIGKGRGDIIEPLKIKNRLCYVLVVPRVKVYSSHIYGQFKMKLTKRKDSVNILIRCIRKGDLFSLSQLLTNDLEPEIIRFYPPLGALKERLKTFGIQGVLVSGSGPAVFGLMKTHSDAEKIMSVFSKRYSRVYVVRTL